MVRNKELDDILSLLDGRQLSTAMDMLATFGCKYPELNISVPLDGIRSDYERMAGYWAMGYKDPDLEEMYGRMLRRMYGLTADVYVRYTMTHDTYFAGIYRRVTGSGRDRTTASLCGELEAFVADVALLELEPEHVRKTRKAELHSRHQAMMSDLFDYVWMSCRWTDGMVDDFERILLSPTVDSIDQQLIVSALTLSAMNMFDINKFRVLVDVYRQSSDNRVRQKALVGWVMALSDNGCEGLFPEQKEWIADMLADDGVIDDLTELQVQMLYCVNTESDSRKIQDEIIPELLNRNNLRITKEGIEEKDYDPMQDIMDPEAAERNMERMEESFRTMTEMEKAGSDIYFGGFAHMKRFPFFDNISNWFVAFYPDHPAISHILDDKVVGGFLQALVKGGTFCDSDKYSCMMAFRQMADRIPQNMREMLNGNILAGLHDISEDRRNTPGFVRRFYLQNLYRFFRLFPSRDKFRNPFDAGSGSGYMFFANKVFRGTRLEKSFGEVGSFLLKKKMYGELAELLDNYSEDMRDYMYYMLAGTVLLRCNDSVLRSHLSGHTAVECFAHAVRLRPAEPRAILGHARSLFGEGRYAEACDAYSELLRIQPDNMGGMLSYSICLTNMEQYDEALKVLYRLSYEHPDNANVDRVMARALTGSGKYEQARKIYSRLCNGDGMENEDIINNGYCEWFAGNTSGAIELFVSYLRKCCPTAGLAEYRERAETDIVVPEREFLHAHGVTETEIQLMLDSVCADILR